MLQMPLSDGKSLCIPSLKCGAIGRQFVQYSTSPLSLGHTGKLSATLHCPSLLCSTEHCQGQTGILRRITFYDGLILCQHWSASYIAEGYQQQACSTGCAGKISHPNAS